MKKIFLFIKYKLRKGWVYASEVIAYKRGKIGYSSLFINITSLCNSNCRYCDVKSLDLTKNLSDDEIKRILAEAKGMGLKEAVFSGGEPFTHSNIWELIKFTLGLKLELSVISNGLLLAEMDGKKLEQLKRLKALIISLDSADPKIHDEIRGGEGFFNKTVRGVKICREAGINVRIASVISNKNYGGLAGLINLADELDVRYIAFQPLHVWSNYSKEANIKNPENLVIEEKDLTDLTDEVRRAIKYSKKKKVNTNLPALIEWLDNYFISQSAGTARELWFKRTVSNFRCKEIFTKLFIDYDGGILPCAMLSARENVKGKGLAKAVKALDLLKADIRAGKFPEECRKCSCQMSSNYIFSIFLSPVSNWMKVVKFIKNAL